MSILDNIKGRSSDEGEPGGKFNPFRLLEIGEIMVRYTDGIRIKDFVFLAILTSERLILIDSARQGSGQITKEIPFSVIKKADLERDERDRPALAISMEVGDQQRVMRLVFTGLINEPDTECREWYTAINGFPPERIEKVEVHLDEPAQVVQPEQRIPVQNPPPVTEVPLAPPVVPVSEPAPPAEPAPPVREPEPVPVAQPPRVAAAPPQPSRDPANPVHQETPPTPASPVRTPVSSPPSRVIVSPPPQPVRQKTSVPVAKARDLEGSLRIVIEKPAISPIRVNPGPSSDGGAGTRSFSHCIHCGARTPSQGRYCQVCGRSQN